MLLLVSYLLFVILKVVLIFLTTYLSPTLPYKGRELATRNILSYFSPCRRDEERCCVEKAIFQIYKIFL